MNIAIQNNTKHDQDICQVHADILYDIQNRTYQDCLFQPESSSNRFLIQFSVSSSYLNAIASRGLLYFFASCLTSHFKRVIMKLSGTVDSRQIPTMNTIPKAPTV